MRNLSKALIFLFFLLFPVFSGLATKPLDVIINEIAWMGTEISSHNEWIELYNNTNKDINLEGWGIYEAGGKILIEPLTGIIRAKSYYLIERTDDTTVPNILASQKPTGWTGRGLSNRGEHLQLKDNNSVVIDEINCLNEWFVGNDKTEQTMERKNPNIKGSESANWGTSKNPGGTPKTENSVNLAIKSPLLPPEESSAQPKSQPELKSSTEPKLKPREELKKESRISENIVPAPKTEQKAEFVEKTKKIDINTAPLKELQKITGIGPALAQRIIDARPFYSVDELTKVRGISPKTLENIKKERLAWVDPGLKPPKIEKEIKSSEKGLAAIAEPFKQGGLGGGIPKSLSVFLIALIVAIFSAVIILILKRKVKSKQLL